MTAHVATRLVGTGSPPRGGHPATFVTVTQGNDIYWRVEAPAKVLGAKVIKIDHAAFVDSFAYPNTRTPFPWSMTALSKDGSTRRVNTKIGWERFVSSKPRYIQLTADFPAVEGALVQTRPQPAQAVLALAMQQQGVRTIAETDDNYFAHSNWNLAFRQIGWNDEMREMHARAFGSHSECVFATAWLRDRYYNELRHRFGKKQIPNLHVCGNHVPESDWPERVERDGPVRVGFMGSTSHVWDINLAYAALHAARRSGCEVVMIGYNPARPDLLPDELVIDGNKVEMRSEKSKSNIAKWGEVVSRHIPWVTPERYHRAALPLDIGLCPLRVDDFTLGKSDVKAIEYTISGAAVVCSNTPVYNRHWKHEQTCLMASSVEEMAIATNRLVRDPKLRYELVSNAQEYVLKNRGQQQIENEWGELLAA